MMVQLPVSELILDADSRAFHNFGQKFRVATHDCDH